MWQQIVVYSIGILVVAYIAVAVYRFATRRSDPCAGCAGCDIKKEFERKRKTCEPDGRDKGCGCK